MYILDQGGAVLHQGGTVLHQGGTVLHQGGTVDTVHWSWTLMTIHQQHLVGSINGGDSIYRAHSE